MKFVKFLVLTVLMVSLWVGFGNAGVLVTEETTEHDTQQKMTQTFQLDKGKVRVESDEMIMIFHKDKDLIWMINPQNNTYSEMTKADAQEISQMRDQMMDQQRQAMEEQLKDLPPEQRAIIEERMKDAFDTEEVKIIYENVGSESINDWKCDKYEGHQDGVKIEEVWAVDEAKLGIGKDEFETLQAMVEFFNALSPDQAQIYPYGSKEAKKDQHYSGISVKTVSYEDGEIFETRIFTEVKNENFKNSAFELPEGLEKVDWREAMQSE